VAIIKPWGSEPAAVAPPPSRAPETATPVAVATASASINPWANYDHEIFGVYEPEPRWELWPAGYLVSFGYAIRIESTPSGGPDTVSTGVTTGTGAGGAAGASPSAQPSATPRPSPTPLASPGAEPVWPATIRVTAGNELAMIGVNTPLGYRVTGMGVTRLTGGAGEAVRIINPASDWPSHFTVIALADESGGAALDRWPPGDYRLELKFEPDDIVRTVEIQIEQPTADDASPSDPPGPSTSPAP
jgi:hypothetical protein